MPDLNDPEVYQTVLENLQTGVYIVDRNRRIRFWNQGAEQITGYLRQDGRVTLIVQYLDKPKGNSRVPTSGESEEGSKPADSGAPKAPAEGK